MAFARPHRALLAGFLVLSVVRRLPRRGDARCWPAGWSTRSSTSSAVSTVRRGWPLLIAVIAIAEAGLGLLSTAGCRPRLGEGLILDLRTAVFDHVQRMPIAFFTRTRTGALVSRLNNDVIGAQRAFTDTLSGVVSNVVTLVLTLVVMLAHLLADHPAGAGPAADLRASRPGGWARGWPGSSARRPTTTRR